MDQDDDYLVEIRELDGQYANNYRVGYNAFEFVIEFGQFYEGNKRARFHTRIVSNPNSAKQLFELLAKSIGTYENRFGSISDGEV